MEYARAVGLVLVVLVSVTIVASASVVAQEGSGVEGASVFPVTTGEGAYESRDYQNRYSSVSVSPESGDALVTPIGFVDVVVYTNASFKTYDYGRRNWYYGGDWHPSGDHALVVGVNNSEEQGGIWRYEDGGLSLVQETEFPLQGVEYNTDGEALVLGTRLTPTPANVLLYTEDGKNFQQVDVPADAPVRDVAWGPGGERALITTADGALLRYEGGGGGGSVEEVASTDAFLDSVTWNPDGTATVAGSEASRGGLPAGNGTILRWDGEGLTERATTDEVVTSIAWKPDGDYAIGVGGRSNGTAFVYRNGTVRELGLDPDPTPLKDVAWVDGNNALLVGDFQIWRYSLNVSAEGLPPTPSLSVVPNQPTVGEEITLNGYGSTSRGTADAIRRWEFHAEGVEDSTQSSPRFGVTYNEPGSYDVGLRVVDDEGEVSDWLNTTVEVSEAEAQESGGGGDGSGAQDGGTGSQGQGQEQDGGSTPWLPIAGAAALLVILAVAYLYSESSGE